jgi:Putative archaeal flagellar protein D/E
MDESPQAGQAAAGQQAGGAQTATQQADAEGGQQQAGGQSQGAQQGGGQQAGESGTLSPIQQRGEGNFEYASPDHLSTAREKPYLSTLPNDYLGDLVVMEWLEFLVKRSTVTDAARAINYYERIDWVDPAVADHLRSFLSGFGNIDRNKIDRPGTDHLTREHHIHSLKYIMKLNGATATSVILDRWDTFAPDTNGV